MPEDTEDFAKENQNWTEAEEWALKEITSGRPADFHARHGELDPNQSEFWDSTRQLSPEFLKTLTYRSPWSERRLIDERWLIYRLPKPRQNGRTELVLSPLELIGWLMTLCPAVDQLQSPLRSRFRQLFMPGINRGTDD